MGSVVVIPAIVLLFKAIKRHYAGVAENLEVPPDYRPPMKRLTAVVLVEQVNGGALEPLAYGTSIAPDHLLAVHVAATEDAEQIEKEWSQKGLTVPLEIVRSLYGEFLAPTLVYIDELQYRWDNSIVNVLIPELLSSTGGDISCTTRAR